MDHAERIDELEARLQHEVATRERLEKELQENESRYRMTIQTARERGGRYQALVRALPDAMFSLNSEGVYLDYIPAKGFETLYPPEEFLGKSVHEIMPSDIAEASMHFIKEALRTNELQRFEYDLSMGGEWLHFEAFMVPEENEAAELGWCVFRFTSYDVRRVIALNTMERVFGKP